MFISSPLIILPVDDRPGNICVLGPFITSTEQQYNGLPSLRVIDSIARANIDPQFPHPCSTEVMIAKVTQGKTVDAALNCDTGSHVTQTIQPVLQQVAAFSGQVV
jgi:hypothetical protein